jgi:hypothetical protein
LTGFRRLTAQSVGHPDGYVVQSGGRFGFQYVEGDHVASIYCDPGPPADAIYLWTLTGWDPPFDEEPLTEAKREEIIERILAGLDFLEVPYEVVSDGKK